jgi:secreted trypsin-like serine protease
MIKKLIVVLSLFVFIPPAAVAVEDGSSATGNAYVVPIIVNLKSSCTGVMISKNVAATAAHCILDDSKQISKNIYVGAPGTKLVGTAKVNVTHTFIPDDFLGNSADNRVGDSDIAFLVLDELYSDYGVIEIASENDLSSLKSKRAPLRVIGYGNITNSGENDWYPHLYDGVFESNYQTALLNSFGITSTKGNACTGDSGSPILSITPKKVMLVGILTGGVFNEGGQCSKKGANGNYSAVFSGVSRYSNALHLALVQGSENLIKNIDERDQNYSALEEETTETSRINVDLQFENEDLKIQLSEVKIEVERLRKMKKILTCMSGSKSKTVIGVNPVCPKGYKEKL